ncbi:SPOC like C-terminal domain-containing protein [Cristinia sonorae]|uniref:ATP-dependent DNA helicase II subunit 1 n=1 Tax=Cristinia sonorae TaxID=1940300 RepID=A0A8K0XMX5_9AGAR|nr:SPOC like C-terminal domain-containing protein [Cristinia sonorae]
MAPYDEWNRIDDDDDDELQDSSLFEGKRDVILFAIDCSESMLELYEDPNYEDVKTCHLLTALESAMQIAKRKVVVGPNDAVGIMLFNTTRKNDSGGQGSEIKQNNFVYQPIATINAESVKELIRLLDEAREDPDHLRHTFPPLVGHKVPMGDVFTSCNWIMRDGAPKTASKRVFLITDSDDPNAGPGKERLMTSARTTLIDLTQAGIMVEPFFISTEEKPFDQTKFYSSVLLPNNLNDDDGDPSVLPESISITRIDDLLAQMRFHEVPKRALFSVPFELSTEFVIGVKGYGLVTEQKKGSYRYFVDLGDRMEVVESRTAYVDNIEEGDVDKNTIVFGMALGETVGGEDADTSNDLSGTARTVPVNSRVFFTNDEIKSFRTMGLEPRIKLLGFKDKDDLKFEDNVKHSYFIYPDEMVYSGSKRTFSALIKSMVKKEKIGIALALLRRNSSPVFCALLPQEERAEEGGWNEPAGIHIIPLPYADDIRAAPIQEGFRASDKLKDATRKWIDKLTVKNGSYPPDSYPNPALAYHNAQLEASAFRTEFDPEEFEDLTLPKTALMHKRAGPLMKEWMTTLQQDETANTVDLPDRGKKRKAVNSATTDTEVRAMYEDGKLAKLTNDTLKEFCRSHGLAVSGKKADLVDRVTEYLDVN